MIATRVRKVCVWGCSHSPTPPDGVWDMNQHRMIHIATSPSAEVMGEKFMASGARLIRTGGVKVVHSVDASACSFLGSFRAYKLLV